MLHQFPDYSLINRLRSNGHLSANMDSGIDELTEITSHESSPDTGPSSNILPLPGRRALTAEHLRIFTYVLLGMLCGVLFVVLFIDFYKPAKIAPAPREQEERKEQETHESTTQGA